MSMAFLKKAMELVTTARQQVVRHTNSVMVFTYFQLRRLIVENEQGGKRKANYGDEVIKQLSAALTKEFGEGFSARNLASFRLFYLYYQNRLSNPILQTPSAKLSSNEKLQTLSAKSLAGKKALTPLPRESFRVASRSMRNEFRQLE